MDKNCDCCMKKWKKCNCICSKCGDDYANCRYDCMLNYLHEIIERNRQKIIKRWNDLEEQGRKEVEMMEKDEESI